MEKTYRVLNLLLLSIGIVMHVILFTVGLNHDHLGPERKWTYPLFWSDTSICFALELGTCFIETSYQNADQMN